MAERQYRTLMPRTPIQRRRGRNRPESRVSQIAGDAGLAIVLDRFEQLRRE